MANRSYATFAFAAAFIVFVGLDVRAVIARAEASRDFLLDAAGVADHRWHETRR